MSATLVKICGVTDAEGARAAAEAGADMIGLHFCDSSRRVDVAAARRIVDGLERRPTVVGVFIDASPAEVDEVAEAVGLDLAQLHGSETAPFGSRTPVLKVLKVRGGEVPDPDGWPDPLLLDSWSADGRGGTGRAWPWAAARELAGARRVIVAGGLNPGNVGEVVRELRPYGVDVSSGVESAPGRKDPALVRAFVEAVHGVAR